MITIKEGLASMKYIIDTVCKLNIETDLKDVKVDLNGRVIPGNYIIRKQSTIEFPSGSKDYYVAMIINKDQSEAKGLPTLYDAVRYIDENLIRSDVQ